MVLENLSARQMPPAPVPQPPSEARRVVIEWIEAMRRNEARKETGDPDLVARRYQGRMLRDARVSHAETG